MVAILDFTDVKNVIEGREGRGPGSLFYVDCLLEGTAPYGRLLLAPAEGWGGPSGTLVTCKNKK